MSVPVRQSESQRARENLSAETKAAIEERKQLHLVAAKISEMNWGKGLSPHMQNAVAAYCKQNKLDPTEIDLLGGNLYRNSRYYLRRLSEMIDDNLVDYARPDHVHLDKRLIEAAKGNDEYAAKARLELQRREAERVAFNIPDAAAAAVVFRVKLKNVPVEFTAAKWCGGGTRKSDPVGDTFPVETAETRACRRVMRYLASQIPGLKWREEELDDRAQIVSASIVDEREAAKLMQARGPQLAAHYTQGPALLNQASGFQYEDQPIVQGGEIIEPAGVETEPVGGDPPAQQSRSGQPAEDFQDDRDLIEEPQRGSPPGSKRVDMPKPGRIQDALDLNDQPKRGRDALREG